MGPPSSAPGLNVRRIIASFSPRGDRATHPPETEILSPVWRDVSSEEVRLRYHTEDHIASGAFSDVFRARDLMNGNLVAIKVISRIQLGDKGRLVEREVAVSQRCDHPNLVKTLDVMKTATSFYIVMEYNCGGDLFERIIECGHMTPEESATIMHDVLLGLQYLHSKGISHRDLKPENLLFLDRTTDARCVITDFGLANIMSQGSMFTTPCGTPGYVAPEVLSRKGYTHMADMWSLGVVAYTILCGYPPFHENTNQELFDKIRAGAYQFDSPFWDDIPQEAINFVHQLLHLNPADRMTSSQALQHPFILMSKRLRNDGTEAQPGMALADQSADDELNASASTVVDMSPPCANIPAKVLDSPTFSSLPGVHPRSY